MTPASRRLPSKGRGRITIMHEQLKNGGCGSTLEELLARAGVAREGFLRKVRSKLRHEGQVSDPGKQRHGKVFPADTSF